MGPEDAHASGSGVSLEVRTAFSECEVSPRCALGMNMPATEDTQCEAESAVNAAKS